MPTTDPDKIGLVVATNGNVEQNPRSRFCRGLVVADRWRRGLVVGIGLVVARVGGGGFVAG